MTHPTQVTLFLRYPSQWGDKLVFSPRIVWIPFQRNRDIDDLIDRIDQARLANDQPVTKKQAEESAK